MRISDWSSDVCSSDLVLLGYRRGVRKAHGIAVIEHLAFGGRRVNRRAYGRGIVRGAALHPAAGEGGECHADGERQVLDKGPRISPSIARPADRQSADYGKSVSGQGELGGRGCIQNKKATKEETR